MSDDVMQEPIGPIAAARLAELEAENERLRAEAIPVEALAWLFGTGPDHHGKWFDESKDAQPSTGSNRPYWWRPYFRKVIEGYRAEGKAPRREE